MGIAPDHPYAQPGQRLLRALDGPGALPGRDARSPLRGARLMVRDLVEIVVAQKLDARLPDAAQEFGQGLQVALAVVEARDHAHAKPDVGRGCQAPGVVADRPRTDSCERPVPRLVAHQLQVEQKKVHVGQNRLVARPDRVPRGLHRDVQTLALQADKQRHERRPRLQQGLSTAERDTAVAASVIGPVLEHGVHHLGDRAGGATANEVSSLHPRVMAPAAPHGAALEEDHRADPGAVVDTASLDADNVQPLGGQPPGSGTADSAAGSDSTAGSGEADGAPGAGALARADLVFRRLAKAAAGATSSGAARGGRAHGALRCAGRASNRAVSAWAAMAAPAASASPRSMAKRARWWCRGSNTPGR